MLESKEQRLRFLRIVFWWGVIVDGLVAIDLTLAMLISNVPEFLSSLPLIYLTGNSDPGYQYVCGTAAGLMWGWTALLYWAIRDPFTRKDIAPLTMIVVVFLGFSNVMGFSKGYLEASGFVFQIVMQLIILVLLFLAYGFAKKIET